VRHMALSTEKGYVHWIRRFILFHNKRHRGLTGQQGGSVGTVARALPGPNGTADERAPGGGGAR
jgi:hypothetical protein